jgi:sarcosine oxidase subunit beta
MNNTADVIIIGGGIQGASLAFHLAQRGLKAAVLEQRFVAAEATGRSSGLVRMHYDLELESQLAWVSFQYFRDWEEKVGGDCGFTRTGFLKIVPPKYEEQLRANVAMHQEIGINSQLVTADEVAQMAPYLITDDFNVAAYEPESGYADPSASTMGLMGAAREQGAVLVQECQVTELMVEGGKVSGVKSSKGEFSAPVVVNAAGAWAAWVGRLAGLELPVKVWRHDTIFIRQPAMLPDNHLTVIDDAKTMYFRPETGGLTLLGLEDGNPVGDTPDEFPDAIAPDFVDRAVDRICQRIPLMEQGSLHSGHGGIDGITPDQRAIMGQAGPDGFYLVCGFSGTGFKIGPAVGLCMTELIVDGRAQTVDIEPFALSRFAEGKELVGEHAYDNIWT